MGWSIGFDTNWQRDIGYGVPALCDHPECFVEIDRGLAYVCGGEPYGGSQGCGLYFCGNHLCVDSEAEGPPLCERCRDGKLWFEPKPDVIKWLRWKLTDDSWEQWRQANPEQVAVYRQWIATQDSSTKDKEKHEHSDLDQAPDR